MFTLPPNDESYLDKISVKYYGLSLPTKYGNDGSTSNCLTFTAFNSKCHTALPNGTYILKVKHF